MKVLIIDSSFEENSLFSLEYINPIKNILLKNNIKFNVIHYLDLSYKSIICQDYTHIIISGTGLGDNEFKKHINKFKILKKLNCNIFGICAGAQIIAEVYGEEIGEFNEIGIFKPELIGADIILKNVDLNNIYVIHNYFIKTNNNFIPLIKTEIHQLLKHKLKNIYLCLFHPEVKNKKLIENFINLNN